jgi:Kef-type K+ transport system membrane component KefB/CBS domain-containing protein
MPDALKSLLDSISLSGLNNLLILLIALLGSTIGGRLWQKFKIPEAVGFIVIGIIIGHTGFQLAPGEIIHQFAPLSYLALSLVSFTVGGELKKSVVNKFGRQLIYVLFFEKFSTFIIVGLFIFLPGLFFLQNVSVVLIIALLLGSIAAAAAGSSSLFGEYKAKGPLTNMVLRYEAFEDIFALFLFAIFSVVSMVFLVSSRGNTLDDFFNLLYEPGISAFLAAAGGYLLARLLRVIRNQEKILSLSLGAVLLMLGLTAVLHGNIIISALIMGIFLANYAPRQSNDLFNFLKSFSAPIYALFFILAGTAFAFGSIGFVVGFLPALSFGSIGFTVGLLAALYFIARTAGKIIGTRLGGVIAKTTQPTSKYLPYCLLGQSGLAVGLALVGQQKFPGQIGNIIIITVTAVTFFTQLMARPLVKYSIKKCGEAGLNLTEEDIIKILKAKDLLSANIPHIHENTNLKKVFSIFSKHDNLCYPVVDNDHHLLGVISINSIKETLLTQELSDFLLAHDIMESPFITCTLETPLLEVEDTMRHLHLDCLAVIKEDNLLAGIIERRSIQKFIATKLLDLKPKT